MQIFNEKSNKYIGRLISLIIIFIVLSVIKSINLQGIVINSSYQKYELYKDTIIVLLLMLNIMIGIIGIIIFYSFIKIRETEHTKKLYTILLWVKLGLAVVSYSYSGLMISSSSVFLRGGTSTVIINTIAQAIYYLSVFLPVPIYILIIIREKLNYNWMIIGSLTSFLLFIVRFIVLRIKDSMQISTQMFDHEYPILELYTNSQVLHTISDYFWIIGLIVMIMLFKLEYRQNKEMAIE